jgi:hypothetical protein
MIDERWAQAARTLKGEADFWSLRIVDETIDDHEVRDDVAQPLRTVRDRGAMLIAYVGAGAGYAATANLSACQGERGALADRSPRDRASGDERQLCLAERRTCLAEPARLARAAGARVRGGQYRPAHRRTHRRRADYAH